MQFDIMRNKMNGHPADNLLYGSPGSYMANGTARASATARYAGFCFSSISRSLDRRQESGKPVEPDLGFRGRTTTAETHWELT
jgi:hypothetical protein